MIPVRINRFAQSFYNMIITKPVQSYKLSMKAYNNFANIFNSDKKYLRERLNPQHNIFFNHLVREYRQMLFTQNKIQCQPIDSNNMPPLSTNRAVFANITGRSKRTISDYITKLMKVGAIIKKINHGPELNFELWINPELLIIFDENNPKFTPKSKYLELADFEKFRGSERKNLQQFQVLLETSMNNKIIGVETVDKVSASPINLQETFLNGIGLNADKFTGNMLTGNTGEYEQFEKAYQQKIEKFSQKNLTGGRPAQKNIMPDPLENLKALFTSWLLNLAIALIWKNKKIHPAQLDKAYSIIYNQYFDQAKDSRTADVLFNSYKLRLEAAARNINHRIKPENLNIYPAHYFDRNNKNGFAGTANWNRLNEHYKNKDRIKKQLKTDTQKLTTQFTLFLMHPKIEQYNLCVSYIKKNIPHLESIFVETVSQQQNLTYLHAGIYSTFREYYNQQYL